MKELGGNMYQLEGNESLVDAFDPQIKIVAPEIVRQESIEIDGKNFLRFQGVKFVVGIQAETIQEAIQKSKS